MDLDDNALNPFGGRLPARRARRALAVIAVGLLLATGTLIWVQASRGSLRPPLAHTVPLWTQHHGLEATLLERALPEGAFLVLGLRDIPVTWGEIQGTRGTRAYQTQARPSVPHGSPRLPSIPDWLRILGSNGVVAFYPPGLITGPTTALVLLEANDDADVHEIGRLMDDREATWYVGRAGNVWVLSPSRVLTAQAAQRVTESAARPPGWIDEALRQVPSLSRAYAAFNPDAVTWGGGRPETAREIVSPLAWVSGGMHFENLLWTEVWGPFDSPSGGEGFLREAPRPRRFPFPREADPALFMSVHGDLKKWRHQRLLTALIGARGGSSSPEKEILKNVGAILPDDAFLSDEAGLYVGGPRGNAPDPMAALFFRLKHPWLAKTIMRPRLERAGWKREGSLWVRRLGARMPTLGAAFMGDFLVAGTAAGVKALLQPPTGTRTSSFSSLLATASIPERVNTFFGVDPPALAAGLRQWEKSGGLRKSEGGGPGGWRAVLDLFPPLVGYSVHAREGLYARTVLKLQDHTEADWNRVLQLLAPDPSRQKPPFPSVPQPALRIETRDGETFISIQGTRSRENGTDHKSGAGFSQADVRVLLNDSDWVVRRDAALALGERGLVKDIPHLKRLARDPVPAVREAAQAALETLEP